jgi:hypothetical protein
MIEVLDGEVSKAPYLVVAFTGLQHGLGGIPFEFHRTLGRIDCTAMFIKDQGRRWYQYEAGVLNEVKRRILEAADRAGAKRTLLLGNSMGGFGALLFGALCNADAILGIVPQTAITPDAMRQMKDKRWAEERAAIHSFPCGDLLEITPPAGKTFLCLGDSERRDTAHVDRICRPWKAEKIVIPDVGHHAAAKIRDEGRLVPMIEQILAV